MLGKLESLSARLSKLQIFLLTVSTIAIIVSSAATIVEFGYGFLIYRANHSPPSTATAEDAILAHPFIPSLVAFAAWFILAGLVVLVELTKKKDTLSNWIVWGLSERVSGSIIWGLLACVIISMFVTLNPVLEHDYLSSAADVGFFIGTSASTTPDYYFSHMIEKWYALQGRLMNKTGNWSEADKLEVRKLPSEQFEIFVNNPRFGPGAEAHYSRDLGEIGKEYSKAILAKVIWMCGSHIRDVLIIRVDLSQSDRDLSAEYDVTLSPSSVLYRHWPSSDDEDLQSLVSRGMVVVKDTASGKHWVEVPAH